MYKDTWILVANSSKARLLKAESNDKLTETEAWINSEMRMKGTELYSDRPGRSFDIIGEGRHHMGNPKDIKEEHAEAFSRTIGEKILDMVNKHTIKQLYIVASPRFMGMLQKNFDPNVLKLVKDSIDKDLTMKKPDEVRPYLPHVL